ncbi:MAG: hypothetical protein Q4A06_04745 [Cardiobacteriaceae bacterium]|nr:hypothetical protein [Cardiobacteriaceae bacterium]
MEAVESAAGEDRIYAFGVAGEAARGQLGPGDLAMMGGKYWYVVYRSRAEDLLAVLKADLPERFRIMDEESGRELAALRVVVDEVGANAFSSHFCLTYPADGKVKDKLEALEFYQVKGGDYVRCFTVQGHLYASPKAVAEDYRFKAVVPVALFKREYRERRGVGRAIGKALLTPVTMAADAVGAVTVYPAAALAIQASGGINVM